MKIRDTVRAYGTPEGVRKGWESRPRAADNPRMASLRKAFDIAKARIESFNTENAPNRVPNPRRNIDRYTRQEFDTHSKALENFIRNSNQELERAKAHTEGSRQDIRLAAESLVTARNNVGRNPVLAMGDLKSGFYYLHRALNNQQIDAVSQAGESGWQYGRRMDIGFIPRRTMQGFPRTPSGGRGVGITAPKLPGPPKIAIPKPKMASPLKVTHPPRPHTPTGIVRMPKPAMPKTIRTPSFHAKLPKWSQKTLEAELGEPNTGVFQHAHIEPITWFRPPSAVAREKGDQRIPTDDPRETNDRFLDVTKRRLKETQEQRMKMLKRSIPGGNPPIIPVRTTAVEQNSGVFLPGAMYSARLKRKGNRGMFVSYSRRGIF